eukprot:CAMPEP_0170427782 /NCGR_PEP_ID=MMETSP0117_2-20130122/39414_1 /TAXON_ID=400756 /ORGANISM="Durinskia baltica, Strain CSIRO CS-38" /LENGTH=155 /DNA_ID=CAMNT_0010687019 /DNA_START=36 /DNA_END=501 /DNA_ORIENTATION=-
MTQTPVGPHTTAQPCCGPQGKAQAEPTYIHRSGGQYKKVVTYEFVGDGRGDFERVEEPDPCESIRSNWRLWAMLFLALVAVVALVWFVVWHMGGAHGNDHNSTNATNANNTNTTNSSRGTEEIPDWFYGLSSRPRLSGSKGEQGGRAAAAAGRRA